MESKGLRALSVITVAVLVVVTCALAYSKLAGHPLNKDTKAVYTPVSRVDTFSVDYELYGNLTTNDYTLKCDIANSVANKNSTRIYLKDDTGVISEYATLGTSDKCTMLKLNNTYTNPGEYKVHLIYEVIRGDNISTIVCPYVVLVNGGQS